MIGTSIFHMNIIMNYHCSHNCEAVANNVSVCLCYVIAHAHTQTDGTSNAEGDVLIAQHLSHQLMQPFPTHKYTTTPRTQTVDNMELSPKRNRHCWRLKKNSLLFYSKGIAGSVRPEQVAWRVVMTHKKECCLVEPVRARRNRLHAI